MGFYSQGVVDWFPSMMVVCCLKIDLSILSIPLLTHKTQWSWWCCDDGFSDGDDIILLHTHMGE